MLTDLDTKSATARQTAANNIAQSKQAAADSAKTAKQSATAALTDARNAVTRQIEQQAQLAARSAGALHDRSVRSREQLDAVRTAILRGRDAAYQQAVADSAGQQQFLGQLDTLMANARALRTAASNLDRAIRDAGWAAGQRDFFKNSLLPYLPAPPPPPPTPQELIGAAQTASPRNAQFAADLWRDIGGTYSARAEQRATARWGEDATSAFMSSLPGAGALSDAIKAVNGRDIWGRRVSQADRLLAGGSSLLSAAGAHGLLSVVGDSGNSMWRAGRVAEEVEWIDPRKLRFTQATAKQLIFP